MQVKVETTEGVGRKMRVVVPADEVQSQVDEKIRQTARKVKLNGFRPGKVPLREVKRRFGDNIRQEVSTEVIQTTCQKALREADVKPAGLPRIEAVKIEEGQDLEYTAVFEVIPDIKLAGFEKIEIKRPVSEVKDADIDRMIETLQEQRQTYSEVDRASQEGDRMNVDYTGFLDGEAFEGGEAKGAMLIVGAGAMIPEFEEALPGMSAGEEKEAEITFPETYANEQLAGKAVLFKIKANEVAEPQKPELNDEFFKLYDVEEGGLEAFRAEIKANMERELETAVKARLKDQVMDGLARQNEVELPESLVAREREIIRREFAAAGIKVDEAGEASETSEASETNKKLLELAERRVKISLLISSLVEQNGIEVDEGKVRSMIDTLASSYEEPEQVVKYYYQDEQRLSQVRGMALEEQVVDFVMASAKVSDEEMPYEDAVKRSPLPGASDDSGDKTA